MSRLAVGRNLEVNLGGGPAPYWLSWTYNNIGLRTGQTDHKTSGDLTTTYTYPAAGAARPHTLSSTTTTGIGTKTYDYDEAGNTSSQPKAGTGANQTMTWDPEGHLGTATEATNTTSY